MNNRNGPPGFPTFAVVPGTPDQSSAFAAVEISIESVIKTIFLMINPTQLMKEGQIIRSQS